ncbi:cytochrome P450 [Aphelenchoides avenae]|nr:cytochrome P450 [Aphelenchus avenae]
MDCANFTDDCLSGRSKTQKMPFPLTPLLLFVVLYFVYEFVAFVRKYPRGPLPWPLVGNLLQIFKMSSGDLTWRQGSLHRPIIQWARKYGNVFTIWLPKPVVVIADLKTLHEALVQKSEYFSGRPMTFLYTIFTHNQPEGDGIILAHGPRHTAQRRFAVKTFRNLGMGKSDMERRINFHKDQLIERIAQEIKKDRNGNGVVMDPHHQVAFCFGNIIHDLVMGRVYNYNDEEFVRFKEYLDMLLENIHSFQLLLVDTFPIVRFFLPSYYRYVKGGFALQQFFLEEIERHERQLDVTAEPTNFMDAYLKDMYEGSDDTLSKMTLALDAGDLWTGGLETVVTTIRWAIIYFINYPDVQKKLQEEIDGTLGNRAPTYGDRLSMPYLRATIDELQRIINVLPWHIPHSTPEHVNDIILDGKRIPPGTKIFPAFSAVHFDERIFPEPEVFRPERFITAEGKYATEYANTYLNPFGMGKRECLGKSLAQMELALVLTSLVQNFHFEAEEAGKLPSLERVPGMTSVPKPYRCRISQRQRELVLSTSIIDSEGQAVNDASNSMNMGMQTESHSAQLNSIK